MAYKQFYLLPIVETVVGIETNRSFKYMATKEITSIYNDYAGFDYGARNQGIVCVDAEQADHDALALNTDVFQFPVDLDSNVAPVDLQPLRSELNSRRFTSDWVLSNAPYKGVVRNIMKSCQIMRQVMFSADPFLFDDDLSVRGDTLSASQQTQIEGLASSLNYEADLQLPLEVILKDMMESYPSVKNGQRIQLMQVEV